MMLLRSGWRAWLEAWHPRMQLLAAAPIIIALALWAVLLWFGLQPLIDWIGAVFASHGWYGASSDWLSTIGFGFIKIAVVPMLAFLSLLPLMAMTALILVGAFAMPAIVRHVAARDFGDLERRGSGGFWASLLLAAKTSGTFLVLWLAALPLYLVPPLALAAHIVLWGWVTQRLFSFDALSLHASAEELEALRARHRGRLLAIGIAAGLGSALPSAVWLGGAVLSIALFPILAISSVWLFVLVFIVSGLWFTHYCLQALRELRQ